MNWYLSNIVFSIVSGEGNHVPQFDEQLRLIRAENKKEAWRKANAIGKKEEEDSFVSVSRLIVKWKFVGIIELHEVEQLTDGMELHSHIRETDAARPYIQFVKDRARRLSGELSQTALTV